MMTTQIVEIQPREIKFLFEVKKQSSCAIHLANVTDQYVAFKVKTTSPKKYCVRPNVGIIKPKSTCDFTVIMQAQKSAQSEMQSKDKFLIQCTVVPFGTTVEEITPSMFSKDSQKYIEETKLRVVLLSAPNSPTNPPVDAVLREEASKEMMRPKESQSPVLLPVNEVTKQEPSYETSMRKDKLQNGIENFPPPDLLIKKVESINTVKNMEESRPLMVTKNMGSALAKDEFYPNKDRESKQRKDVEEAELKLTEGMEEAKFKQTEDIEELKSKISARESKLVEAKCAIEKLKEENCNTIREKEMLKQQLATLRGKRGPRKVQVGFPPLFVCMVMLISWILGFLLRA